MAEGKAEVYVFQEENFFVIPAYLSSRLSSLDGDDGDERADSTWQLVALVHMATFRWESPFVQK